MEEEEAMVVVADMEAVEEEILETRLGRLKQCEIGAVVWFTKPGYLVHTSVRALNTWLFWSYIFIHFDPTFDE